jgi:ketosteroid isomerase-like protein
MSRENLEAAAALYELYERGDIGAMVSRMDPDLEVDLSDRLPDAGVLHGREAYRAFLETSFDVWAEFRVEAEAIGESA